jgi:hypothetical protein
VSEPAADAQIEEFADQAIASGADPEKVSELLDRLVLDSSANLASELKRRTPRMIREHGRIARGFERRLRKRWKAALDLYYAVYVSCLELGEEFNRSLEPGDEPHYRLAALIRLHVRACLVASEIHALLRTGHANGAMARARTLHEHAVIALVLSKAREEDAERYQLHAGVERYKRAKDFQRSAKQIGYEPFSEYEMAEMKAVHEALIARFDKDFAGQYGWACSIVGKSRPTLRDLEDLADLSHLRPYYQWFCDAVHAGAKGAEDALVVRGPWRGFLCGPSNAGLADPAQVAMGALAQVTTALVLSRDQLDFELVLELHAILKLSDEANVAFVLAHERLERDEASIEWPSVAELEDPGESSG